MPCQIVPQDCSARVSDKSVPQHSSIRVSDKSVVQEYPTKVSYKSVPQECPARVSHKIFPQEFPTRVSVIQEYPTRVSYKSFPEECPARVSHKSDLQECLTRVFRKSVPQEYPKSATRVPYQSVPQDCSHECWTRVSHECSAGVSDKSALQERPTRSYVLQNVWACVSSTCLRSGSWLHLVFRVQRSVVTPKGAQAGPKCDHKWPLTGRRFWDRSYLSGRSLVIDTPEDSYGRSWKLKKDLWKKLPQQTSCFQVIFQGVLPELAQDLSTIRVG